MSGSRTSIRTRSGCRRRAAATPSSPVEASPASSNPSVAPISARAAFRKVAWSSTVRTRTEPNPTPQGSVAMPCGSHDDPWDGSVADERPPTNGVRPSPAGGAPLAADSLAVACSQVHQDRGHPAADHLVVLEAQLLEDRPDVLLDRPLRQDERFRDGGVAPALGHLGKD